MWKRFYMLCRLTAPTDFFGRQEAGEAHEALQRNEVSPVSEIIRLTQMTAKAG